MLDKTGRTIDYIRISVTDRCNFRCRYCMPETGAVMMKHQDLLTFEEIARVVRISVSLGITKIKLTGGEPLVRKGIVSLVGMIREIPGVTDITMTSNGCLLGEMSPGLKRAGLLAVNVSLDTLNPERFADITRRNAFDQVLEGIQGAREAGLAVKINCAVMEDMKQEEFLQFAAFARKYGIPVRFIEMMPIGQGRVYDALDNEAVLELLKTHYPGMYRIDKNMGNGPAVYYSFSDSEGSIGFISAVHHKFCQSCNRIRLTPDGFLKLCLASGRGIDLRTPLRMGIGEAELTELIKAQIEDKPLSHHFGDRGWEDEAKNSGKTMNQIGG